MTETAHTFFMRAALEEALSAFNEGEVPVGAVAVEQGVIVASAHNRVEAQKSVSRHAEIELLRQLEARRRDWRMSGITVYVTKEPCPMCAGALVNARVDAIVFGVADPAFGGCGGAVNIPGIETSLHHPEVLGGVEADAAAQLLRDFFRLRRKEKNSSPQKE
ncbi:MAG: nucleoside deaminase [Victivallaceae bacterium]|nr:nucleoside deaminase [Victivallaceae bacterium]